MSSGDDSIIAIENQRGVPLSAALGNVLPGALRDNRSPEGLVLVRYNLAGPDIEVLNEALDEAHWPNFYDLAFTGCQFDREALWALIAVVQRCDSLQSLSLFQCSFDEEEMSALVQTLPEHPALAGLAITGGDVTAGLVGSMVPLFARWPRLQHLNLGNFAEDAAPSMALLMPALGRCASLHSLCLDDAPMGDPGVGVMACYLGYNPPLETLSLKRVGGSASGYATLLAALANNRHLRDIDLGPVPDDPDLAQRVRALRGQQRAAGPAPVQVINLDSDLD